LPAQAGAARSDTVNVNCFSSDFGMPFGGFKQSGVGREGGPEGVSCHLEYKPITPLLMD
jgi:aldehyde dehydrogenase (NAD+)